MDGVPLLPIEWARDLSQVVAATLPRFQQKETTELPGSLLCKPGWFKKYRWQQPPALIAAEFVDSLMRANPDASYFDTPVLQGQVTRVETVRSLPLLTSTWELIDALELNDSELTAFFSHSTVLDLFQRLGSSVAALDVVGTTRSWSQFAGNGALGFVTPTTPDSVDDAFQLARLRFVRQAGLGEGSEPDDVRWAEMLGRRAGIDPRGRRTLEEASQIGGITRERVRQRQAQFNLSHELYRRWPLSPELESTRAVLRGLINDRQTAAERALHAVAGTGPNPTIAGILRLLEVFGHSAGVVIEDGRLRAAGDGTPFAGGVKVATVRRTAWELSGKTGVVRRPDVVQALQAQWPDVAREELGVLVDEASAVAGLPLQYLLVGGHDDCCTLNVARRMLDVAETLDINTIAEGLARRARGRQTPPPPPAEVLLALYEAHPDFAVAADQVQLRIRSEYGHGEVIRWLIDQIRSTGLNVMHRTTAFDAARQAGLKPSTIGIYLSFHELLVPAGPGCVAVVGDTFHPEQVAMARRMAADIRIPTNIYDRVNGEGDVVLKVVVGNDLCDNGTLNVGASIKRRIGLRRLKIQAYGVPCGTSVASGTGTLTGFQSAINQIGAVPGDSIEVVLDLEELRATVAPITYEDDEQL